MTSRVTAPEIGDSVIIQIQTKNSQCMELSGSIEEISGDCVHFAMDSIHLTVGPEDDNPPIDGKIWRQPEAKPLKMSVSGEKLKLLHESDDDVAWIMSV